MHHMADLHRPGALALLALLALCACASVTSGAGNLTTNPTCLEPQSRESEDVWQRQAEGARLWGSEQVQLLRPRPPNSVVPRGSGPLPSHPKLHDHFPHFRRAQCGRSGCCGAAEAAQPAGGTFGATDPACPACRWATPSPLIRLFQILTMLLPLPAAAWSCPG